jgi:hypothetical protein
MKNLEYWYGDDVNNKFRTSALELISINIQGKTRPELTLKEECMLAAKQIYAQYPDIHIALSGGWESQICLQSFIEAGITPNVYILKFPQGLNYRDYDVATSQCKKFNIIPKIIDVSFESFIKEHMMLTTNKYQTYSFFQSLQGHYISKLNENVLLVDKLDLRRDVSPDMSWSYIRNEDFNFWPDRFNAVNEKKIVNNFFSHSPELMYSFLTLPIIKETVQKKLSGKISLNSLKNLIYFQGGFTNLFDERTSKFVKTISTENIPGLQQKNSEFIQHSLKFKPRQLYLSYTDLISALENQGTTCQYI